MTFAEYLEQAGYGAAKIIMRRSGVSTTTLYKVRNGTKVKRIDIARRISAATEGQVSVAELLDPKVAQEQGSRRCRLCGSVLEDATEKK